MSRPKLPRNQHAGFGKEIRSLLTSTREADQELAGWVADALDELAEAKADGRPHRNEERLTDDLRDVQYLKLYPPGASVRVYFTVADGTIWVLHLDESKRRTAITDATKTKLKNRLREIRENG